MLRSVGDRKGMETPPAAVEEEDKVALSKKFSDLGGQIKETEKLIVEVDRELKESDAELATKRKNYTHRKNRWKSGSTK